MTEERPPRDTPFTLALISGACAGTTVDIALYPLDTLKVRMQSEKGFLAAGGFRGVYNGVLATALGAAPGAAFFFSAYEWFKPVFRQMNGGVEHPLQHSLSASVRSCQPSAACECVSSSRRRAVLCSSRA
jgi:solute carrier family 25 S-adenosylmethionine transporter 26